MPNDDLRKTLRRVLTALAAYWLASLIPGGGHFFLRRPLRGAILFVTITATFWAGMAMGGAMTVDPVSEPWWFAADMLTGVNGLAGWACQQTVLHRVQSKVPRDLGEEQFAKAVDGQLAKNNVALVAPVDTAARAYCGVAGLLNLLCVADALFLALMGRSGEVPPADTEPAEPKEVPAS
jgi:hypothetical protein